MEHLVGIFGQGRWCVHKEGIRKLNIFSLCLQFLRRNHTPNGRLSPTSGESPPLPPPLTSTAPVTYIGLHEDQDLTVGVFAINPGANVRRLFLLFYSNLYWYIRSKVNTYCTVTLCFRCPFTITLECMASLKSSTGQWRLPFTIGWRSILPVTFPSPFGTGRIC